MWTYILSGLAGVACFAAGAVFGAWVYWRACLEGGRILAVIEKATKYATPF